MGYPIRFGQDYPPPPPVIDTGERLILPGEVPLFKVGGPMGPQLPPPRNFEQTLRDYQAQIEAWLAKNWGLVAAGLGGLVMFTVAKRR